MTPDAETLDRVRKMIAVAKARGMTWGDMRTNAHKAADSLGTDIAATITSSNDAFDSDLGKLATRAATMRAEYAAFLELWFAEAETEDKARQPAA